MNKYFLPKNCPCYSGHSYDSCCKPFHEGKKAPNALELMRSRFSAYAFALHDYIINTTHPASPYYSEEKTQWKKKIVDFSQESHFDKLDILDFKEHGTLATVTFVAHIRHGDEDATFTEKSYFEQKNGIWLYRSGQLTQGYAPNLITTEQMRLLPLAYYGDDILRKPALPVHTIDKDIEKLIEEMEETMDASNGIGLAAPQVHHSIQLFLTRAPIETDSDELECGEMEVFINPILSDPSVQTWTVSEGCLSLPTIHGDVARPEEITIEYTDRKGKRIKRRVSRWAARVIMHENDHLHGTYFIDHLQKEDRQQLDGALDNLQKRLRGHTVL